MSAPSLTSAEAPGSSHPSPTAGAGGGEATPIPVSGTPQGSVALGVAPKPPSDAESSSRSKPSKSEDAPALKPLPLPSLEETCSRYVEVVRPLLSAEEFETAKEEIEKFRSTDGPRLHEALSAWEPTEGNRTYLEKYWYQSYLGDRQCIAVNVNPFFVLEEDPTPSRNSQVERATSLIISCLKFHQAVLSKQLKVDTVRGTPLCMAQYEMLFHATRIPEEKMDRVDRHPTARHIAVMCRGQVYWFNVYSPDARYVLAPDEIARNLRLIRDDAWSMSSTDAMATSVGVLTTTNRDVWAHCRAAIEAGVEGDTSGAQSLRVIDSSLFVVCLDHESPHNLAEQSRNFLHGTSVIQAGRQTGTCCNRWYDKSLQIIVCENGSAGVNFEHSHLDGHTVLRFASDVFTDTILRFAQTINGGLPSVLGSLPTTSSPTDIDAVPKKIVWRLPKSVLHRISRAEAQLSDLINRTEVECLEFSGFGKHAIVSHKMSPDAFIQLAFQLTYYRLYGELVSSYETVMTKKYNHGRTAAQRPCTDEAYHFAEVFCSDASSKDKVAAFREAIKAQVHGVQLCAQGKDVERHMFALKCLAVERGEPVPEFFKSHGWTKLTRTILSTSNCGNPSLRLFGFGPVTPEGFGVGYLIKNDGVQFCISSFRRQTKRYMELLQITLSDMRDLLATEVSTAAIAESLPAGSVALGGGARARASSGDGFSYGAGSAADFAAHRAHGSAADIRGPSFSSRHASDRKPYSLARDSLSFGSNRKLSGWLSVLASTPVAARGRVLETLASTAGVPPYKGSLSFDDIPRDLEEWISAAEAAVSR